VLKDSDFLSTDSMSGSMRFDMQMSWNLLLFKYAVMQFERQQYWDRVCSNSLFSAHATRSEIVPSGDLAMPWSKNYTVSEQ
jgi:hypothetical protein